MSKKVIFFLIFLAGAGCSCRRKRNSKIKAPQRGYYVVTVKGMECRQCVHAALRALIDAPGVVDAVCHCSHGDYENAWISAQFDTAGVIPLTLMQHRLTEQDLTLASVQGRFSGLVEGDCLSIAGLNAPVRLVGEPELVKRVLRAQRGQATVHVRGVLDAQTESLTVQAVES